VVELYCKVTIRYNPRKDIAALRRDLEEFGYCSRGP
jgi:hypothetical protein